jgi:hypothetical protein
MERDTLAQTQMAGIVIDNTNLVRKVLKPLANPSNPISFSVSFYSSSKVQPRSRDAFLR